MLLIAHVVISLAALAIGGLTVASVRAGAFPARMSGAFLVTTALTCLSGFPLPADRILPSHIVGVLTLIATAVAGWAQSAGARRAYGAAVIVAFYFNAFVTVVQLFRRLPALHALAPTESEPPFALAQLVLLIVCVVVGRQAWTRAGAVQSLR